MKDCAKTIKWLKEIRMHFENDACFNGTRREAIDDAISKLEHCEEEYQRGYIDSANNTAKEYVAEIQKIIDEKISLERKLDEYEAENNRLNYICTCCRDVSSYYPYFRYNKHTEVNHDLNEKIDKLESDIASFNDKIGILEKSVDLRFTNALQSRCEIRDQIGDLKWRVKKLEEQANE